MNPQKNITLTAPGNLGLFGKTSSNASASTSNNTFRNILIGGSISIGLGLCLYLYFQYSHVKEIPQNKSEPEPKPPAEEQVEVALPKQEEIQVDLAPVISYIQISQDSSTSPIPDINRNKDDVEGGYWLIY